MRYPIAFGDVEIPLFGSYRNQKVRQVFIRRQWQFLPQTVACYFDLAAAKAPIAAGHNTKKIKFPMQKSFLLLLVLSHTIHLQAQNSPPAVNRFLDVSGALGDKEGTISFSYVNNWRVGKSRKFEVGLGARSTFYSGTDKPFYTAPARLARSTTIPFIIVFAGHDEKNIDTLTVRKPSVFSLNLSANFGYRFSSKWYGGVNIDLIGFSLGSTSNAFLLSNGAISPDPAVKPAHFNLLLTGDNDYGSLNSEFFMKYKVAERWQLKAVYQFYFAEYKTTDRYQVAPDGTKVDRFRNKVNASGSVSLMIYDVRSVFRLPTLRT
ncbi:MAG TPA: hypothetical protein VHE34_12660 [Puia sp.]|uniref:hypothetical protein n=1 Tax=Puia sp. TaxID=2045100 RepID=UPI002BB64914|nr:hypothetical protein [Puia sp.]HVU96075.1 hypothetical protein [Puia sp.]